MSLAERITKEQRKQIIREHRSLTNEQLARMCGCCERTIQRAIDELELEPAPTREYLLEVSDELDKRLTKSQQEVRRGSTPEYRLGKLKGDNARLRQQICTAVFRLPVHPSYSWKTFVDERGQIRCVEVDTERPTDAQPSGTVCTLLHELETLRYTPATSAASEFTRGKSMLALMSGILHAMSEPEPEQHPVEFHFVTVIPKEQ